MQQPTIHNILVQYFDGIVFKYIEERQQHAIYVANIDTMLGGDMKQYVIVFVKNHLGIRSAAKLCDLPWVNLQTRMCKTGTYKVFPQPLNTPKNLANLDLQIVSRDSQYSWYNCKDDTSFEICILHIASKKTQYQYPNTVNLHWAINQFRTIFNKQEKPAQLAPTFASYEPDIIVNANFELL